MILDRRSELPSTRERPLRTRLKVCCIASVKEAQLAVDCGADAVGLVGAMPSGPGPISDNLIAQIAPTVPPGISTFLLTKERTPEAIVAHVRKTGVNTVQIVNDDVDRSIYAPIRDALPHIRIVQVLHVKGAKSVDQALTVAPFVDALLLDSGNPSAPIQELGGTGRVHDWAISHQIVKQSSKPVYLAGGITPDNIATAIKVVQPFGIDLCSGVRVDKQLNRDKLLSLVAALRSADLEK